LIQEEFAKKLQELGCQVFGPTGQPDFLVQLPTGDWIWVEHKHGEDEPTEQQAKFHEAIRKSGARIVTARRPTEVFDAALGTRLEELIDDKYSNKWRIGALQRSLDNIIFAAKNLMKELDKEEQTLRQYLMTLEPLKKELNEWTRQHPLTKYQDMIRELNRLWQNLRDTFAARDWRALDKAIQEIWNLKDKWEKATSLDKNSEV
jgi:hypothetical protein